MKRLFSFLSLAGLIVLLATGCARKESNLQAVQAAGADQQVLPVSLPDGTRASFVVPAERVNALAANRTLSGENIGAEPCYDRSGYPYNQSSYPYMRDMRGVRETVYPEYGATAPVYRTRPVYYRTAPVVQRRVVYSSDYRPRHKRSLKKSMAIVGGSAGGGALIGALAGGKKGAAIGAVSGGLAGLAYDLITRHRRGS